MTGSNKFISYDELKDIGTKRTTSLAYNERYVTKTFILTHILPFSLFYNDTLFTTNPIYSRRDIDSYRYNDVVNVDRDLIYDYYIMKTFYVPNNNRNRTVTNIINSNK